MEYKSAKNPKWQNPGHTRILLTVHFEKLGEVPFSASPKDSEQHGRELFKKASEGEFGEVSEFVPGTLALRLLRSDRNIKLMETDWEITRALETGLDATELKKYRQSLRDLPATASPKLDAEANLTNVIWPEKP